MSFQSLPQVESKVPLCGTTYTEFDGRDGAYPCRCTRPEGHQGRHGWGSPSEIRAAERRPAAVPAVGHGDQA